MSSTVLVKFVDVVEPAIKYEYQGKSYRCRTLSALQRRAKDAGLSVEYTVPVQRFLADPDYRAATYIKQTSVS